MSFPVTRVDATAPIPLALVKKAHVGHLVTAIAIPTCILQVAHPDDDFRVSIILSKQSGEHCPVSRMNKRRSSES